MSFLVDTPRLRVRPFEPGEAEAFHALSQDPGFNRHSFTVYRQPSVDAARAFIEGEGRSLAARRLGMGAVVERATGALVGMAGLREYEAPLFSPPYPVQVTYRLVESAWGKGYGTEVARALVDLGLRELRCDRIIGSIAPDNTLSRRVLEKLGMRWFVSDDYDGRTIELFEVRRLTSTDLDVGVRLPSA